MLKTKSTRAEGWITAEEKDNTIRLGFEFNLQGEPEPETTPPEQFQEELLQQVTAIIESYKTFYESDYRQGFQQWIETMRLSVRKTAGESVLKKKRSLVFPQ